MAIALFAVHLSYPYNIWCFPIEFQCLYSAVPAPGTIGRDFDAQFKQGGDRRQQALCLPG